MSGGFEKETTASTAKSLVGALVALGAGFVFMFLGLVSVTASSDLAEGDRSARVLLQTLQSDLMSYQPGTFQLSADRAKIRFQGLRDGKPAEVVYQALPEVNDVTRSVAGDQQRLARLSDLKFSTSDGLLKLTWRSNHAEGRCSLALNRWGKGRS